MAKDQTGVDRCSYCKNPKIAERCVVETCEKGCPQAVAKHVAQLENDLNVLKGTHQHPHFVPASCKGEMCRTCYIPTPATHKLEETIFFDDPFPSRHPLTAYVCCDHFRRIVGGHCE